VVLLHDVGVSACPISILLAITILKDIMKLLVPVEEWGTVLTDV